MEPAVKRDMFSLFRSVGVAAAVAALGVTASACGDPADAKDLPPITVGAIPEDEPTPTVIANIGEVQADITAISGDSYSYLFSYRDATQAPDDCDFTSARIVVQAGVVTDAVALHTADRADCRIDATDAPTIPEVFDIARSVAGASDFHMETGPADATIVSVTAKDGDVDVEFAISKLSKSTAPTAIGWDEVNEAAAEAETRWSQQSSDHTVRIGSLAASADGGERISTVVDGRIVKIIDRGTEVDPDTVSGPMPPHTVDDLFTIIASLDGHGHVAAAFDPNTGVPTHLWFDPIPDTSSDDLNLSTAVDGL